MIRRQCCHETRRSWRDSSVVDRTQPCTQHCDITDLKSTKSFLQNLNSAYTTRPRLVATTAASDGWRVTYLGPSLPAEEIAGAAHQSHARAVALSLVYPDDDPFLRGELVKLRRGLGDGVVLVGGRAADAYRDVLGEIGAVWLEHLSDFRKQLEVLRLRKLDAPQAL